MAKRARDHKGRFIKAAPDPLVAFITHWKPTPQYVRIAPPVAFNVLECPRTRVLTMDGLGEGDATHD